MPSSRFDCNRRFSLALVGQAVKVDSAVNCEILADAAEIAQAEGCALVAKSVRIGTTHAGRHDEMRISILVPDLSSYDDKIASGNTR